MNCKTTFGIPDTLPPLGIREVWNWLWLGVTGLLLVALGLFPHLIPPPWGGLLVLVCWLALPVRGLFGRNQAADIQKRMSAQVRLYTLIVVSFGVSFTIWAGHLSLSWPVIIGILFFIEALPSLIVSLTEWWRLSTVGLSSGLMICGFVIPFVEKNRVTILIGGAVAFGSLLSAGILYLQLRHLQNAKSIS